jgi:hypothetical protein
MERRCTRVVVPGKVRRYRRTKNQQVTKRSYRILRACCATPWPSATAMLPEQRGRWLGGVGFEVSAGALIDDKLIVAVQLTERFHFFARVIFGNDRLQPRYQAIDVSCRWMDTFGNPCACLAPWSFSLPQGGS